MPYLQVYNDNNALQIDDSYRNLYLSRKIQVTNNEGDIKFQDGEIIAAIGNGTNTLDGYCSNNITGCHYKVNQMLPIPFLYIFTTRPVSPAKCGMQVFNENGELIFDSNHKQAKVILVGTNSGYTNKQNIAIAVGGKTIRSNLNVTKRNFTSSGTERKNVCENKLIQKTVTEEYTETEWRTETYKVWEPRDVQKNEYVCENVITPGGYEYKCENKFVDGTFKYVCENVYIPMKTERKCDYKMVTRRENVEVTKTRQVPVPVRKTRQVLKSEWENVCEWKYVPVIRNDIQTTIQKTVDNVLPIIVNGSISTKVFDTKQDANSYWRLGREALADSPFASFDSLPIGEYPGYQKSSGDIFAFSYIIFDVSGL